MTGRRPRKDGQPATSGADRAVDEVGDHRLPMTSQPSPAVAGLLRPVTLGDRHLFDAAFSRLHDPISDATFASCYLWAETLAFSWAVIEDHLCVFSAAGEGLCLILPPLALSLEAERRAGACVDACFALMDRSPGAGEASRIEYVSDELLDRLRAGGVELSAEPMYADYVYPARAMIDLAGGPLKGKRKLRSAFLRDHPDVVARELTAGDIGECEALLDRWKHRADATHEDEVNEHGTESSDLRAHDERCTRTALREWRALGLESMGMWSGGRLLGFTFGERLGDRGASVLIEKVEPGVRGAAQFIFSEFCRQRFADCDTINVGDDWGIPALRYTKTSYRPTRLVSKSVLSRPRDSVRTLMRRGEARDTAAICEIEQTAFAFDDERFTRAQVRRLIANPRASVLVAERGGRVIGWSATLTRRVPGGVSGRLYAIAVAPDCAGCGVGRALATAALDALDGAGARRVSLEVRADNGPAIGLYRSLGFAPCERLDGYYGVGRDGVRMRRDSAGCDGGRIVR